MTESNTWPFSFLQYRRGEKLIEDIMGAVGNIEMNR